MDSEQEAMPAEHVTVDQIVARNIRHWRREAHMTQEELGQKLGWSAANVSAAERSADSARDPRRFDAQTLTEMSLALGVPLAALFLPPEDDGERAVYVFTGPDGDYGMGDLMERVVMTDSDDDAPVMQAYRRRYRAADGRYLDPEWRDEVASWLRHIEVDELRADRADRLRAGAESLREQMKAVARSAAELDRIAAVIDPERQEQ